ncbi:MAG: dienelactone hydrolase family protein [Bdellovibrionales bacterium]
MKIFTSLFLLFAFIFNTAHAKMTEKTVEYKQGDTTLEGFLVLPPGKAKKPAVIIVHEWDGLGDYVKERARQVAQLGYVAFGADIYGKGVRGKTMEESKALSTKFKSDRNLMRARINAAFDEISKNPLVDKNKIAVMGYCFGGTTALELARSGADLKGTVSFHGGLSTPNKKDAANIKGKVLVLHGADDPAVPAQEVSEFQDEMRSAKVDWQLVSYGNTVHAFTNKAVGNDPKSPARYNADSDRRSWVAMVQFFKEIFQ